MSGKKMFLKIKRNYVMFSNEDFFEFRFFSGNHKS